MSMASHDRRLMRLHYFPIWGHKLPWEQRQPKLSIRKSISCNTSIYSTPNLVWWWTTSRAVNTTKNHEAWRNAEHHHQTNPSLQMPHCSHRHHIVAYHTSATTYLFPVPLLVLLVTHSKMHQAVPSTKDSNHRYCDHRGAKGRLKDRLWVCTKLKAQIK